MKKGVNYNLKSTSIQNQDMNKCCECLMCSDMGSEYVAMKVDNDKIISIFACQNCAKKLR